MCGFVTPLQGSEADEHRKPEVAVDELPIPLLIHPEVPSRGGDWV